ncbi:MAG: hypothetical protein ACYTJ0_07430 [Planctomycetota bacterium]|jgi:ATP-dependent protease HslVU (ClpYQ) peptidase subunit
MSVVVVVSKQGRTVMAADSLTVFGDAQQLPPANAVTRKIRRVGDSLVGSAGWAIYDCILDHFLAGRPAPELRDEQAIFGFFLALWHALHERYPFVNDQAQNKDSPFGDLDSSFLIANEQGMFKVSNDLDVFRFNQYYAIGSGGEYALGAMHALYDEPAAADEIAQRAVRGAIVFDVHCGGEIHLEQVGAGVAR